MRIVSWNCSGMFRNKFGELAQYDPDIYVIQECENPGVTTDSQYAWFARNCIWRGYIAHKGLGVFAKQDVQIENLCWDNHLLRHFLAIKVNNSFTLLAVWACAPYIEEYAIYQDIHYSKFENNMIIMGDFNSNKIWDTKKSRIASGRSHSGVVEKLRQKGLCSAYHSVTEEKQGEEKIATFYMHRNKHKAYHIDYCFVSQSKIKAFSVLDSNLWLRYSDHIPLVLDV